MSSATPAAWARDKARKVRAYAEGDVARYVRAARDVLMPGVPVAALLGCAANGGTNENTTGWISGSAAEQQHALTVGRKPLGGDPRSGYGHVGSKDLNELGPFGPEGNHVGEPVAGTGSAWAELAVTAGVRKVLNRDGVIGERWYGAVADQCAIGVACLARHAHGAWRRLDPRVRWVEDGDGMPKAWTLFAYVTAMLSWSAGDGRAVQHFNAYADQLAAVPETARWATFCRLAGVEDDGGFQHRQDEYSALRTAQKLEAARVAAQWLPDEPWASAWLDEGLGAERDAVMARLASIA